MIYRKQNIEPIPVKPLVPEVKDVDKEAPKTIQKPHMPDAPGGKVKPMRMEGPPKPSPSPLTGAAPMNTEQKMKQDKFGSIHPDYYDLAIETAVKHYVDLCKTAGVEPKEEAAIYIGEAMYKAAAVYGEDGEGISTGSNEKDEDEGEDEEGEKKVPPKKKMKDEEEEEDEDKKEDSEDGKKKKKLPPWLTEKKASIIVRMLKEAEGVPVSDILQGAGAGGLMGGAYGGIAGAGKRGTINMAILSALLGAGGAGIFGAGKQGYDKYKDSIENVSIPRVTE